MGLKRGRIGERAYVLAIVVISLALNMTLRNYGDDLVYQSGPELYGGMTGWLSFYARNWSGRFIPHAIHVLLLQLPEAVFVILNSVTLALLPFLLVRCFFHPTAGEGIS